MDAEPDPGDLGDLLTVRGYGWHYVLGGLFLGLIACLPGALGAAMVWNVLFPSKSPAPDRGMLLVAAVPVGIALGIGLLGYFVARMAFARFAFHEHGVEVRRRGRLLRRLLYAECDRLTYAARRNYHMGRYVGSTIELSLAREGGPSISLTTTHRERPTLASLTILGRTFVGEDELDVVSQVIAEAIADRWEGVLAGGAEVAWTNRARLGARDLHPTHGRLRGSWVPFADISRAGVEEGEFRLWRRDEKKYFLVLHPAARNFYPGLKLFERFMAARGAGIPTAPSTDR